MSRSTQALRTTGRYGTNMLEEVGRQLSFYGRAMGDVVTMRLFRRGYGGQLAAMISDITIGAGALIAALVCIIPLYRFSLFASFFATEFVTTRFFGLSPGIYHHYFRLYLPPIDVAYSLAKACVFAVVVSLIHCYYGYFATGGPAGVGVAVGRAIRLSIVAVVVLNLVMSIFFWGGGNTVKVAG